jgi:hypothetical protein
MAPVVQPFAFAGSLQLAADQSLPQDPIPFNFASQFVSLQESVLNLVGAGTKSFDFGSVGAPGAKGLLIRYDGGQSGAVVRCVINGGTEPLEISAGGFFVWFNPTPSSGATSLSIIYTSSCQLRVWVLG